MQDDSVSDVDECLFRNGFCDELCHNTVGSYRCGCVNGHTPFLKTCISQGQLLLLLSFLKKTTTMKLTLVTWKILRIDFKTRSLAKDFKLYLKPDQLPSCSW